MLAETVVSTYHLSHRNLASGSGVVPELICHLGVRQPISQTMDYKNWFAKTTNVHKWVGEGLWASEANHMVSRVESLAKGAEVNDHPSVTFAFGLQLLGPMEKLSRSFQAEGSHIPLEKVSWGTG